MCGNVRKGVVPVVVIEDASSIAEYEQIGEAVVVVVTHGYAHSEQTLSAYASADGDIGEGAIAVVAVKRASQRLPGAVRGGRRAIYEVQIQQAILVVVDPTAACAHGFD